MATDTTLLDTLPDPNNGIGQAGESGAILGPGYSAVQLSSEHEILNTRTNSGRLISRQLSGHKWTINISYNPMTREQFEPVFSFLAEKRGSLTPFKVSLPQYKAPQNSAFATFVASNTFITIPAGAAGTTNLLIAQAGYNKNTKGRASVGDIFTITDPLDSNHTKTYQVVGVDDNATYPTGTTAPGTTQLRIYFSPALQRAVSSGSSIVFNNPKFRVVLASDVQQYDLNTDNLYSFSLKLEEAQR